MAARRVLAAGVAFSFLFFSCAPDVALALPTGYTVESGTATFDTSASNALVISASDHAIINFDSFSIAQNESVRFIESSSTASVLGRVTGLSSSDIYGSLFSNGQLVLVNPNGFNFGATANVQVGSLIASTLDIQNAMYLKNDFVFQKIDGSNPGSIFNEGLITAADGGHIALLAESVTNKGSLVARLGSVVIGAGEKETLSFDQNGMVSLVVDQGLSTTPLQPAVENDGTISANGGKVLITAKTLSDTLDNLVNNTGVIEATRAVEKNGVIEFVSNGANVNSGMLNSNTLNESGYTFRSTGAIEGGSAFYDNLDGAANISGSIGSNQTDTGDLTVTGNITLTADNLTFTADSDNNGNGLFSMNAATQIDGGAGTHYHLTLKTGDHTAAGAASNANLYGFVNMGTLTLGKSGGTPTYAANSAMTGLGGFTINAGTTFNLNGQDFGFSAASSPTNNGTFKLFGTETFTNVNNLDVSEGTVLYEGDNTSSVVTVKGFGGGVGNDYYNLTIDDENAGRDSYQIGADLHVHGALTVTSGGFDMHTFGITVTGLTSINGANASFAADLGTQRFNGGLTISNGLFDGQLADLVIVGNLLLSGGTFKNPSLTSITVSGNLTNSGGTQDISAANPGDLSLNGGDQTVNGDWTFYTVTKSVTAAHTLTVKAGSTLRAENAMSLTGTAGNLLSLRSDTPGSQFKIKVDAGGLAGSTFDYLDVKDSNNLSPDGKILPTHSVNSGDTTNWFNAFTWTGGAGTNVFGTAGNWDVGAAPSSSTDDVDIVHVVGKQDPLFDANYSIGSLSIAAAGVLDLNGHNLTLTAFSNAGTLKLQGGETLTGFTNDTTQGTVQYTGAAAYTSLAAGNNYYNVNFSGTGSWTLAAAMDANNNVTIGPTATLDTKNGSNYQINVGGNWSDSGTFTARAGTVVFDGTNQEILGNTTFSSLTKSVAATDTLTFEAGTTQTITGTATLKGASGQLLSLRSSAPTSAWDISPSGTRDIQYVDVQDSDNTSGTVISPANSQNSLRNVNWSFGGGSSSASEPVVDTPYPIILTPGPGPAISNDPSGDAGDRSPEPFKREDGGGPGSSPRGGLGEGTGHEPYSGGNAHSPISRSKTPDEDVFAETTVSEGAVDVNGQLVYDGEKISIDGEGRTIFSLRAVYVAIADGWIALRGKTYEKLKQVGGGERPSLAASDDGETVYALYGKSRRLDRIKTGSFDTTKLAALDDDMGDVALSPDGSILVSDASKDFIDVYAKDGRRLKTLSTGSMPSQMVITHDGRFCYVSDRLDGRVLKMDLKSGKEVASFEAGLSPYGLALLPDDSKLYITDTASAAVLVADTSKNKVTRTVPVERAPYAVEVGEGGRVFVTNRASDSVSVIDSLTDRVIVTIPVGRRPTGLAMIPDNTKDGGKFLVANQLSGTVTVGSIRDLKTLQNVPVGTAPTDVVLSTPRKD